MFLLPDNTEILVTDVKNNVTEIINLLQIRLMLEMFDGKALEEDYLKK